VKNETTMEPRRAQKVAECDGCGQRTVLFLRAGKYNLRHPCCGKPACTDAVNATAAKLDAEDAADKAAGRWFW